MINFFCLSSYAKGTSSMFRNSIVFTFDVSPFTNISANIFINTLKRTMEKLGKQGNRKKYELTIKE